MLLIPAISLQGLSRAALNEFGASFVANKSNKNEFSTAYPITKGKGEEAVVSVYRSY